jgi:hypothetical protein
MNGLNITTATGDLVIKWDDSVGVDRPTRAPMIFDNLTVSRNLDLGGEPLVYFHKGCTVDGVITSAGLAVVGGIAPFISFHGTVVGQGGIGVSLGIPDSATPQVYDFSGAILHDGIFFTQILPFPTGNRVVINANNLRMPAGNQILASQQTTIDARGMTGTQNIKTLGTYPFGEGQVTPSETFCTVDINGAAGTILMLFGNHPDTFIADIAPTVVLATPNNPANGPVAVTARDTQSATLAFTGVGGPGDTIDVLVKWI